MHYGLCHIISPLWRTNHLHSSLKISNDTNYGHHQLGASCLYHFVLFLIFWFFHLCLYRFGFTFFIHLLEHNKISISKKTNLPHQLNSYTVPHHLYPSHHIRSSHPIILHSRPSNYKNFKIYNRLPHPGQSSHSTDCLHRMVGNKTKRLIQQLIIKIKSSIRL